MEKINWQALEEREKVLEKEHSNILTSMNNLAVAPQYQEKYEEVKKINKQALEEREKMLEKEYTTSHDSIKWP